MQASLKNLEELLLSGDEINLELAEQMALGIFQKLEDWQFYQSWLQLRDFYRLALNKPKIEIIDLVRYMHKVGIVFYKPNILDSVLPQAFEVCKNIVHGILLEKSTIEDLGLGFSAYTLVEELSIRHSPLKVLQPYLWTWKNLKKIDLMHCQITHIPKEISQLQALESLKISAYNYVSIAEEICQLPALQSLHYEVGDRVDKATNIVQSTIPKNICRTPFLKKLYLNAKGKLAIPDNINLPKLQQLLCYEFNKEDFPSTFEDLSNLTEVYIAHAKRLDKLPDFLFQLPKLERLYLENLPLNLQDIEECIAELKSLKSLVYKQNFAYNRKVISKMKKHWENKYPHIELYLLKC